MAGNQNPILTEFGATAIFRHMKNSLPDSTMYILGLDKTPIKVGDTKEWADWRTKNNSVQFVDKLPEGVVVSTIFLGFDHSVVPGSPPVLWETMIGGGPHDRYQVRYSTYDDALVDTRARSNWQNDPGSMR